MFFSLRGGVPLDLSVFLGRKGNPRSEQGFPFLPKTLFPFLALLRAAALRTCMGFGVFDCLKPTDCSFAENVSCRLSAAPPNNLCKFAGGKLGADSKQIYVRKTNSSCPPRPAEQWNGKVRRWLMIYACNVLSN